MPPIMIRRGGGGGGGEWELLELTDAPLWLLAYCFLELGIWSCPTQSALKLKLKLY